MGPASAAQAGLVEVDGVRLAWTRTGRRDAGTPTLLLAHGLTDSAGCWDRVVAALAPAYDVVRYDARGHGASDRASCYGVGCHTADLVGLARALRLDRPVLVGHSMGSVHAALATASLEVSALVLEDPHWPEVPEDGSRDVEASRRSVVEVGAMTEAARRAHGRARHPGWAEVDLRAWVEAQGQVDPDVVSWFDSWPTTNRWRDHVAALSCPGLLVTGDRTPTVTPAAAAEARARWPGLRTVRVEGAGHDVRRDRFEPYRDELTAFLAEVVG